MQDLSPQPGIEPVPRALEVQSLNNWTTGEASTISVKSFFPLFGHLGNLLIREDCSQETTVLKVPMAH